MILGDLHNFGQAVVTSSDGLIYKPRTLWWEYCFLSKQGPLRSMVTRLFNEAGIPDPFRIVPDLAFYPGDASWSHGRVQRCSIGPLAVSGINHDHLHALGAMVALMLWCGVTDLHHENILLGCHDENLVFAPIDLETIAFDLSLPSQTHLVCHQLSGSANQSSGLARLAALLQQNGDVDGTASLVRGYLESMDLLLAMGHMIAERLDHLVQGERSPIRMVLRATHNYASRLPGLPGFLHEELEQLDRGDIPYFFRYLKGRDLFYWSPGRIAVKVDYPSDMIAGIPNWVPFRFSINGQRKPRIMTEAGALQLALAMLGPLQGQGISETLWLCRRERRLNIRQNERMLEVAL